MIYLGVEEGSKACRLYDPKGKRKHVSKDVRFMETKSWDWDNNGKETIRGFKDITKIYQNARIVETKTLLFTEEEPRNYKEASTDKKWTEAMDIELDSINKNNTWTLTTLPTNQKGNSTQMGF
nr:zinc finger, CCHC-type [Tanacetum cinerariifolium]